jgi:hypothetical protein
MRRFGGDSIRRRKGISRLKRGVRRHGAGQGNDASQARPEDPRRFVPERASVERALSLLIDPTAADFVKANVYKLNTPEPTYLMRATPEIRILFNTTAGGIQVLDVVFRDKLESFREMARSAEDAVSPKKRLRKAPVRLQFRRPGKCKRTVDERRK